MSLCFMPNNCRKHGEPLKYICTSARCNISICESCWKSDHANKNEHSIELFDSTLKPHGQMFDRITALKEQTTEFVKEFIKECKIFLRGVCELEEKQKEVTQSINNEELMNRVQVVKEMVDKQTKAATCLQVQLNEGFESVKCQLEKLSSPDNDREEKESTSLQTQWSEVQKERREIVTTERVIREGRQLLQEMTKLTCEKVICDAAAYNSSRQEILCFDWLPDVVNIVRIKCREKRLVVEHGKKREEVRRDEENELHDIAMTSDNTLYASLFSSKTNRWRVSVLRQSDWKEKREIDTSVIRDQGRDNLSPTSRRYYWCLNAHGNEVAIGIRSNYGRDSVYKWECVYIYRDEKCFQRVRLDIWRDESAWHSCYIGSHLILQTGGNTIAVVALGDDNGYMGRNRLDSKSSKKDTPSGHKMNLTEENKEKERREKEKNSESDQIEESGGETSIKHIILLDTLDICELVWARKDDDKEEDQNEVGERTKRRRENVDWYLFVGDDPDRGRNKCSVYELDMDRVKNGDMLNDRKELEIDSMFPKCLIDNSTLFAMQQHPFNGKPSIVSFKFN
ncbi:uncharacterized protein LOC142353575 isoform X2 [Convolutriloba macropyga]